MVKNCPFGNNKSSFLYKNENKCEFFSKSQATDQINILKLNVLYCFFLIFLLIFLSGYATHLPDNG